MTKQIKFSIGLIIIYTLIIYFGFVVIGQNINPLAWKDNYRELAGGLWIFGSVFIPAIYNMAKSD